MSIEKKSLISTLKTTKKANLVKEDVTSGATVSPTQKLPVQKLADSKRLSQKFRPKLGTKTASKATKIQ